MSVARITRPGRDAGPLEVTDYQVTVRKAFAELGIAPGDDFWLAPVTTSVAALEHLGDNMTAVASNAPSTSRKAARDALPRSGAQGYRIARAVAERHSWGRPGMTADELSVQTELPPQTVSARVHGLVHGGWLERTDRVRKTRNGSDAGVLVATQKLIAELKRRGEW